MHFRNQHVLAWTGIGLAWLLWASAMPTLAANLPPPPASLAVNDPPIPLPAFELPHAQGTTMRSADLHGKVVVVRFWATW